MTVYLHSSVHSIATDHQHQPTGKVKDRTWSFNCTPQCERDVIDRYEFAAANAGGVPLTEAEKAVEQDLAAKSSVEVGKMAAALAELARERVVAGG